MIKQKIRTFLTYPQICATHSSKPVAILTLDAIWCYFRYGAGFTDYCSHRYFEKSATERRTFINLRDNEKIIKAANCQEACEVFSDKSLFINRFSQYIGREILDVDKSSRAQVEDFVNRHKTVILKPKRSVAGNGVVKIEADINADFDKICCGGGLLEEFIVQHPDLSHIYPNSVNTLRIVTMLKDSTAHIVATALRIGKDGVVDNVSAGGFSAGVDPSSGEIKTNGVDLQLNEYVRHPVTNVVIKGRKIPFFEESIVMAKQAALVMPKVRYVGWDVAITNDGPLFVEANHNPGYHVYQAPENKGYLEIITKLL